MILWLIIVFVIGFVLGFVSLGALLHVLADSGKFGPHF